MLLEFCRSLGINPPPTPFTDNGYTPGPATIALRRFIEAVENGSTKEDDSEGIVPDAEEDEDEEEEDEDEEEEDEDEDEEGEDEGNEEDIGYEGEFEDEDEDSSDFFRRDQRNRHLTPTISLSGQRSPSTHSQSLRLALDRRLRSAIRPDVPRRDGQFSGRDSH
jgi:hypothetical protein